MKVGAEKDTGPVLATKDDERITRVGKFLRKTRLDELPQCINVFLGQMSLVGPRPERPFFVEQFKQSIPGYSKRFKVRPGITGLAQVNASYDISPKSKLKYDLLYIKNYSLLLDIKVMLKTLLVMFSKRGAQ
jgi:lipopolysaccharide/colanic/teichoic acid biosynthesis glycosyltransferase